tara:strand:+ start:60 stop:617 length:558 start_codon:yes stop_codon:yes gene_type:complete
MARNKNRVRVGKTEIEISDLMNRMIDQVREGADGEILQAMEDFQAELLEEATRTWPVGRIRKAGPGEPVMSGPQHRMARKEIDRKSKEEAYSSRAGYHVTNPREHSINLFEVRTELDGQGIAVSVINTAQWAWAVRFGRESFSGKTKGSKAWTELISKPGKKSALELADSMTERLVDLAEKRGKK